MTTAANAQEAYDRYMLALGSDLLVQSRWHSEDGGRHLVCGLGVLGEDVDSAAKCPAQIMPLWLAQMVPWFFDSQKLADAKAWGERFYAELKRLDGKVPFAVVHDWQANAVAPLAIAVATKRERDVASHEAVRDLHVRALAGDLASKDEWAAKLRRAYAAVGVAAYADAGAYAYAYAYAYADVDVIKRLADGMVDCLARARPQ